MFRLLLLLLLSAAARAEDDPRYETIIRAQDDLRSSTTKLEYSRVELQDAIETNLAEFLQNRAGLAGSSGHSQGAPANIYVRGGDASQLLVIVDGMVVNDPSDPSGGMDLSTIGLSNLRSVELRQSESVLVVESLD